MPNPELDDLPGGERVARGLRDLAAGRAATPEALLVATARTRLRELGIAVPAADVAGDVELALWASLADAPDPHYRYNALRRELDSFLAALEARRRHGVAGGERRC